MKPRTRPSLRIVLLAATIVFACRGETPFTTPTSPLSSVVSLEITGTATLTSDAETSQLTATATLSDGTRHDVTSPATWVSSNPEVVTVSDAGLVTAMAGGPATIKATYQGTSGTHDVTIRRQRGARRPGTPSPFSFLAGTWVGTWEDTRYNVSGTLEATFTVNGSNVTATGVIGLQSLQLGNETGSGTGTVSGETLNFTFSADTVGNGSGSLSAGGAGSGAGSVTGVLNFGAFTYTGTVTPTEISGTFAFTSPTGGHGVASLTKQ
ncbi:MAG TPA: Ig-like domain-containing protein [Thermoanaerobaculia bacterium]|nr:Ig-like domain-containing protein [Thermoanaerobaculia bacterium]